MAKIFIDGSAGTTGLRIAQRLEQRTDIELIRLAEEDRKDPSARRDAAELFSREIGAAVLAGVFAGLTYILVLLAMNYVTNVSYVQVFRQLGLPIGMGLGVLILKERCTATKITGVILILAGLAVSVMKF